MLVPGDVATLQKQCPFLVVVWRYKARGDREHDLWRYWPPEGCIKQGYDKPARCVYPSKKCALGGWGAMKQCHCCIWYLFQALWHRVTTQDSKHSWFTPLTIFFIHTAYISLLHLLFMRSVSILFGCPVINIRSWHEDMKLSWLDPLHIIHILGSSTSNFLSISYGYGSFNNISGMDLDVSWYRKINV
jgi:hypothetical protein